MGFCEFAYILLPYQHPAAFKKLSYGLEVGSLKDWGSLWSAAQRIGILCEYGSWELVDTLWSTNGLPTCFFGNQGYIISDTKWELILAFNIWADILGKCSKLYK